MQSPDNRWGRVLSINALFFSFMPCFPVCKQVGGGVQERFNRLLTTVRGVKNRIS
jgi:hypothetical protein